MGVGFGGKHPRLRKSKEVLAKLLGALEPKSLTKRMGQPTMSATLSHWPEQLWKAWPQPKHRKGCQIQ